MTDQPLPPDQVRELLALPKTGSYVLTVGLIETIKKEAEKHGITQSEFVRGSLAAAIGTPDREVAA